MSHLKWCRKIFYFYFFPYRYILGIFSSPFPLFFWNLFTTQNNVISSQACEASMRICFYQTVSFRLWFCSHVARWRPTFGKGAATLGVPQDGLLTLSSLLLSSGWPSWRWLQLSEPLHFLIPEESFLLRGWLFCAPMLLYYLCAWYVDWLIIICFMKIGCKGYRKTYRQRFFPFIYDGKVYR